MSLVVLMCLLLAGVWLLATQQLAGDERGGLPVRRRTQPRAARAGVGYANSRVARTEVAERVILRNAHSVGTALSVGGAIHTILGTREVAADGHVIDRLRAGTTLVTLIEI